VQEIPNPTYARSSSFHYIFGWRSSKKFGRIKFFVDDQDMKAMAKCKEMAPPRALATLFCLVIQLVASS